MAQPLVITFPFNGNTYTAEIKQQDGSLFIFVPDQGLHHILPEGKVNFTLEIGIQLSNGDSTFRQDLLLSILGAMNPEKS